MPRHICENVQAENPVIVKEFYFGDPNNEGTWRLVKVNNDLSLQIRKGGTYIEEALIVKT